MIRWVVLERGDETLVLQQEMPSAIAHDSDGSAYSVITLCECGWRIVKTSRKPLF